MRKILALLMLLLFVFIVCSAQDAPIKIKPKEAVNYIEGDEVSLALISIQTLTDGNISINLAVNQGKYLKDTHPTTNLKRFDSFNINPKGVLSLSMTDLDTHLKQAVKDKKITAEEAQDLIDTLKDEYKRIYALADKALAILDKTDYHFNNSLTPPKREDR